MNNEQWEEVEDLASWYGNRIQWQDADHEDLVQEGALALVMQLNSYEGKGVPIKKLSGLASFVFPPAMKYFYNKTMWGRYATATDIASHSGQYREGDWIPYADLEVVDLECTGYHRVLDQEEYEGLFFEEYFTAIQEELGPLCAQIVREVLHPKICVPQAIEEMEAKAVRKARGENVKGYASPQLTKDLVRRTLNLTEGQWEKHFQRIKKFTRTFLQNNELHGEGSLTSLGALG